MKRKYINSKKYVLKNIEGHNILIPDFSDLNNEELEVHFKTYADKQDWAYCEEIWAEAKARGLRLDVPKKYFDI